MQPDIHFKTIAELHDFWGLSAPEHPLVSVCRVDRICSMDNPHAKMRDNLSISNDFYTISIKEVIQGDIHYGRTKYDFKNGTMMFTAPGQIVRVHNLVVSTNAIMILIHKDFLHGKPLWDSIKKYHFFSYSLNEALHLTPREEKVIRSLMGHIHEEYHMNRDEFSQQLLLGQIDTLLKYCNRYYKRQFIDRSDLSNSIYQRFYTLLTTYFNQPHDVNLTIPKVEDFAQELKVSPRYLSDSLKSETGRSAQDHIHEFMINEAKNILLSEKITISETAYRLGFEYPQYFSRLFKKKTGLSPKAFIFQNNQH